MSGRRRDDGGGVGTLMQLVVDCAARHPGLPHRRAGDEGNARYATAVLSAGAGPNGLLGSVVAVGRGAGDDPAQPDGGPGAALARGFARVEARRFAAHSH